MENRVVVTGIGIVSPVGMGKEPFWDSLCSGQSGIAGVTRFDVTDFPCKIAGEVKDFDPQTYMDRKDAKRNDRFVQFAMASSQMALDDSDIDINSIDRERAGVLIGSGVGGIETFETQCKTLIKRGPRRVSPFLIPSMIINMASGQVAITHGFGGPNSATVTACASGTHAIGDAFKIIQRGDADIMLTGGTEASITPLGFAGFCSARAMSTRDVNPQEAMCPFDIDRDGFVMSEGSALLVLESLEHALKRGAHIYSEIVGYGMTCDAYHITAPAPDSRGSFNAMKKALSDGDIHVGEVDYINAHGTSTELNDRFESLAIKQLFGKDADKIAVSSTKSMTGHLLGAAGGIEAAACCMAISNGVLPPTINFHKGDEECTLDYVPEKCRKAKVKVALSNSFGFGGHNAVLAIREYS